MSGVSRGKDVQNVVVIGKKWVIIFVIFGALHKKMYFTVQTPTFGTTTIIEYPPTFMEHIDNHHTYTLPVPATLTQDQTEHCNPLQELPLTPGEPLDQPMPLLPSNGPPEEPQEKIIPLQTDQKENLPSKKEIEENTAQGEAVATIEEGRELEALKQGKQGQGIQKQIQTKQINSRSKVLDFSDLSIRKLPKFPNKTGSDKESANWFLLDEQEDQEDEYYYQDQDEDEILGMEDDASNSGDSDDEEASDDSLPSDYDEDELERNIYFGSKKSKELAKSPEEFIQHYKSERKSLEDEEVNIRNYQLITGASFLPLDLQIEKEALSQSTLNFFNRNYLTYLELNGGKKSKAESTISAESTPTQDLEQETPQQESKVESVVPKKEKPERKRVAFRQIINMKSFKEDDEVAVMNEKEEGTEGINHMEKQPVMRRLIPMSQQMIRHTNLMLMKQPKPLPIPAPKSANGHSKAEAQGSPIQKEITAMKAEENSKSEIEASQIIAPYPASGQSAVNQPQNQNLNYKQADQAVGSSGSQQSSYPNQGQSKGHQRAEIGDEDQKILRQSEEQSQCGALEEMGRPELLQSVRQVIQAQQQ